MKLGEIFTTRTKEMYTVSPANREKQTRFLNDYNYELKVRNIVCYIYFDSRILICFRLWC